MEISGRIALVTGSARRLGRAIARSLAQAGASIAIHHHASPAEAEEAAAEFADLGVETAVFQADLTRPAELEALFSSVKKEFGDLDILINSAATFAPRPVPEMSVADWDRVLHLNLRAPFFCSQAAAGLMAGKQGKIINIADLSAFQPWPDYAHHCIAKAGLVMMTRVLARALAPGIHVNAVAPGTVLPPDDLDDSALEALARATALQRIGAPSDVSDAVRFLIESDYVTGETIVVDGGRMVMTR